MHARVATFNLGDDVDQAIDQVRSDVENDNRPPGLEDAKGIMMLVDRSSGKSIGITFFDDEEGLKRGDEALNAMSPSGGGSRTGVEFYEVAVQKMD
jgi:exopolysaccharide biosynthesis protein